jgi:hypothetical protein
VTPRGFIPAKASASSYDRWREALASSQKKKLHLSQWGRVKALADHLGFKVQRLKGDQCRLLMPNVEANDTFINIELTDTLTNIEALLREAAEENCSLGGRKS